MAAVASLRLLDVAGAGAMLGLAVYLAQTVKLEALAPGALPAAVATFTLTATFLAGRLARNRTSIAGTVGRAAASAVPELLQRQGLPAPMMLESPTQAASAAPATNDGVVSEVRVAKSVDVPPRRTANGWKTASFIVHPTDDSWRAMRGYIEQVARPATVAVIEAVVVAARRQWHSGQVPLKKDGFVADILTSPEVMALGTMAPRMDVVRKILDGEHPTLIRAAMLQRALDKQPTA